MNDSRLMTIVEMTTSKERSDELNTILKEMVTVARNEGGCEVYQLYEVVDCSGTFVFYEIWTDERSLNHHLSTEHFLHCADLIKALVTSPVRISVCKRSV